MKPPLSKRGGNVIRELNPPARFPQSETSIYASRVKTGG